CSNDVNTLIRAKYITFICNSINRCPYGKHRRDWCYWTIRMQSDQYIIPCSLCQWANPFRALCSEEKLIMTFAPVVDVIDKERPCHIEFRHFLYICFCRGLDMFDAMLMICFRCIV